MLLHLARVPWAQIGEHIWAEDLAVTANTYGHVVAEEAVLEFGDLLPGAEPHGGV